MRLISGNPPPPVDQDDSVMGLYRDSNQPPQPGHSVYTISWLGHRITNVRVIALTSVVLLFASNFLFFDALQSTVVLLVPTCSYNALCSVARSNA